MKVLFAASEVFPFSKTGGLADVSGSLPLALKDCGIDISVISPFYKCVQEKFNISQIEQTFQIPLASAIENCEILKTTHKNVTFYFVKNDKFYYREGLYTEGGKDYEDNASRFIFFSKAIAQFAKEKDFNIVHLNDWQTALSSVFLKKVYNWKGKIVLTIHNLGYQGIFWAYDMPLTNLDWELFNPKLLEFYGHINFLKGGIYTADAITTVSPKYAKEILTEAFGFGLHGVLKDVEHKLYGILNGIDYEEWSPEKDKFIKEQYNEKTVTKGKKICKEDIINIYKLQDSKKPLFGIISRLVEQKGWDILIEAFEYLHNEDISIVVLGTGEHYFENTLRELHKKYEGKIGIYIGYDNALAHKIEAGADFLLMPSKYEPCGLNQMISMRYGTIPVVNPVGGLFDTVIDIDESKEGTGIRMKNYTVEGLIEGIKKAKELYKDPLKLARIRRRIMKLDYSWNASAKKYLELYKGLLSDAK